MHIYIYISKVKFVTVVDGDLKALFLIATTPRCRGGHNSFLWIAPLYPWSLPYTAVLSKVASRTIFCVFGMTRPGIEPRSPEPLAKQYIYIYIFLKHPIYIYIVYIEWVFQKNRYHFVYIECSPIARETWVQSQVESYQRLKKWYLMPPCLTLSIIRYGSRVKWSNPGKGVAPFPTQAIEKGAFGLPSTMVDYIYTAHSWIND